jgi:hypothetical protein
MGRVVSISVVLGLLLFVGGGGGVPGAFAAAAAKGAPGKKGGAQAEAPKKLNACGCYADGAGKCFCSKPKGKCVCPGECEPTGCEAKRAKDIEREVAAETKKAAAADKKQRQTEKSEKSAKPGAKP